MGGEKRTACAPRFGSLESEENVEGEKAGNQKRKGKKKKHNAMKYNTRKNQRMK